MKIFFPDVTEKEVRIVIHKLNNDKRKHGGEILHKFIRLILNPTSEIGYFSNTWKLNQRIYAHKKAKERIISKFTVIKVWCQKIVWLVLADQISLF